MSRRTEKNVGIIGLGIIGRRVAECLRHRGFSVFVWNRTPRPVPNFVGSPVEIAQLCDFIQIFVSDDEALLETVQHLKQSLKAHHIVLAHSTVAPHTMRAAAEIVQRRGAQFLDAPFTGSKTAAEKGELVYYIGGDEAAFRRARPVLEASSKEIIAIGEIGQATTVKIATNMVTAATIQAGAEALALVHRAGLDPQKLVAAMRGNASNSATLAIKLPKMIERDFDPHFSVKHMLKDVQIASRMARSYGMVLGATETARDSLLEEMRRGRADDDFSSLVRNYLPEMPVASAADEETDEAEQHPSLGLEEQPSPPARAPEEEPVARKESAEVPVAQETANENEPLTKPELPPILAEESDDVVQEAASEETEETEFATANEGTENEDAAVEETAMEQDEIEASSELTTAPEIHAEPAALPEPVPADAAAEEGPKRGFFSRMFGKGMDY